MSNEELYQKALEAITRLFSDQSVSQAETMRQLDELIGEIRVMQDTLKPEDIDDGMDN